MLGNSRNSYVPGVFGIVRPVLLWPRDIETRLDDAQVRAILAHELAHVRRRDNLTAAVHMVVEAIFWFYPLVWWIGSRLVNERERACDEEVVRLTSAVLPLCAAFQLFDALTALCNGVLRGIGRQHFGGYVQLFCYYVIAMPISFGTTFGLGWGLWGLWTGVAIALGLVFVVEFVYLGRTDWNRSVEEARLRNVLE